MRCVQSHRAAHHGPSARFAMHLLSSVQHGRRQEAKETLMEVVKIDERFLIAIAIVCVIATLAIVVVWARDRR